MAKKWAAFPHPDKAYAHDAAGLKKHWARLHRGDCEPLPEGRRRRSTRGGIFMPANFADAVDAGTQGRRRGHRRRGQGADDLRQLPREIREGQARAARGGGGLGRRAPRTKRRSTPTRTTSTPTRSAATARASRSPRRWRKVIGGKIKEALTHRHQARAEARGRAHRVRVVSGRDHRQGRRARRRHDLRREKGLRARALPEGAEAQSRFGDRADRIRERAHHAVRQERGWPTRRSSTRKPPRASRRTRWSVSTSSSRAPSSSSERAQVRACRALTAARGDLRIEITVARPRRQQRRQHELLELRAEALDDALGIGTQVRGR